MSDVDLRDKVNDTFTSVFSSHARDLVVYGGAGAGKSWAAAQKLIVKCFKYKKRKVLVIRKYGPSLRHTCFTMVTDILKDYDLYGRVKVNLSEMNITYPNGSMMLFVPVVDSGPGRDPASRLKSFTDVTDMWFEEPTELSFKEWDNARLRMRGSKNDKVYRQRIYTFNPIDKNHWLHSHFFDRPKAALEVKAGTLDRFKYTYRDNRFVDDAYINELKELKDTDPIQFAVYAEGEWGVLGNQIYTNYEVREFEFADINPDIIISGCDFGFESPSAWAAIGVKEKTLYIRREVYQRRLTNSDFIERIQGELSGLGLYAYDIPTYCDAAEPARIEEMERAGLLVYAAEKNVPDGIQTVKGFKMVFHPDCNNAIKEVAGYKLQEDRHGNVLDRPVKFNDHVMDLIRYAIYTYQLQYEGPASDYEPPPYRDEFDDEGEF